MNCWECDTPLLRLNSHHGDRCAKCGKFYLAEAPDQEAYHGDHIVFWMRNNARPGFDDPYEQTLYEMDIFFDSSIERLRIAADKMPRIKFSGLTDILTTFIEKRVCVLGHKEEQLHHHPKL